MPAVEHEIRIVYGTVIIGGDSDFEPVDYSFIDRAKDTSQFRFSFAVARDTAEDFAADCFFVEEAFRTPYQDLLVTIDGAQILSLSQTNNTGLDAVPVLTKGDDIGNTGRSRIYEVSIDFGAPADKASMAGRRDSQVEVTYSASRRRTATLSGTWTAAGSNDARAQYEAQFPTWRAAVLTALTGTWDEPKDELADNSTNDKTLEFRVSYTEIIRAQGSGGLNDAGIVDPTLIISRESEAFGDSIDPSAKRLVIMEGTFEASIDKDVTTDLDGKFDAIKSWLIDQIKAVLNGGTMAVVNIRPEYDEHENKIRATFRCQGLDAGSSSLIESRVTVTDSHKYGRDIVPAWTGHAYSAYVHDVPAFLFRSVAWVFVFAAELSVREAKSQARGIVSGFLSIPDTSPHSPGGGGWIGIDDEVPVSAMRRGVDPDILDVTEVSATFRYRWVAGLDEGGGGTSTPTPILRADSAKTPMGSRRQ